MKKRVFLLFILSITALTGCSMDKKSLGLGRQTPDEFMVVNRKPLSMPPKYSLTPPELGAEPLTYTAPEEEAEQLLLGESQSDNIEFPQDTQFLRQLSADSYERDIRQVLEEEMINDPANNKYLIDSLMFWGEKDNSVVIDNMEEAKRLKENRMLGLSIDEGEVPIIEK